MFTEVGRKLSHELDMTLKGVGRTICQEDEEMEDEEGMLMMGGEVGGNKVDQSILDRQEQWLAQKHNKIHSQRREQVNAIGREDPGLLPASLARHSPPGSCCGVQEAALQTGLTFTPDTNNSRRTVSLTAIRSRRSTSTNPATGLLALSSVPKSDRSCQFKMRSSQVSARRLSGLGVGAAAAGAPPKVRESHEAPAYDFDDRRCDGLTKQCGRMTGGGRNERPAEELHRPRDRAAAGVSRWHGLQQGQKSLPRPTNGQEVRHRSCISGCLSTSHHLCPLEVHA